MKRKSRSLFLRVAALLSCTSICVLAENAAAQVILAVNNNGDINAGSTWSSGFAPVAGDTNQWGTSNLKVRTGTQTWEGQELIVQSGGELGQGFPGSTLSMNGDLTLDGGKITTFNNLSFVIDLQGNTFNLNSGKIDSGFFNSDRDVRFENAVLAGSGTIAIEGGEAAVADRSDVVFESSVDTSGFTGIFTSLFRSRLFLPEVTVEDASFGINIGGTGGLSLANDLAVTSAQFNSFMVPPGSYTQAELLAMGVNNNRFLGEGTGVLTVVSDGPDGGDWDLDGDVDGEDFLLWQRSPGTASQLADWRNEYGVTPPLAAQISTVPEPTSCALLAVLAFTKLAGSGRLTNRRVRAKIAQRKSGWVS